MLWRLSHRSSSQDYLHGENPCSIILYDQDSEELCSALCGRLLSRDSDILLVALGSTQQGNLHTHLQAAYPKRSITFITAQAGDVDKSIQTFSGILGSWDTSLFISCIKAGLRTGVNQESQSADAYPIQLFADTQKAALPHLVSNAPSALVIVSNTLSSSLDEDSEYFKSFVSSLSEQLKSHGHNKTQVTFMEYYDDKSRTKTNSLLSPTPEALSDSILRALGHDSTHVIPYWSHELLVWFIWFLSFVLPPSLVMRFVPS